MTSPGARPDAACALTEVLYSFQTGGSERVGADVARHVSSIGVPTTVCCTHGGSGPISDTLEAEGIPCEPLQVGGGGRIGRAFRLFRHLRAHGTVVLHVQHFDMLSVVLLPARLAGVRRIVVTEHTDERMRRIRRARWTAERFGPRVDAITVVHEGIAAYLRDELGLPPGSVQVIPNGVNTHRFRPRPGSVLREELQIAPGTHLIGSVGRLHPDKHPMNLVRALESMPADHRRRVHVVFVGDGSSRPELEAYVAKRGLAEHVTIAGERQDVDELLPGLDIFVVPSRTEGVPVALLEAMSCGLPVIATSVGGIPTVVEGWGVLVPPNEPALLGQALVHLCGDTELRKRMGEAARRQAVAHYDIDVTLGKYASVLWVRQDGPAVVSGNGRGEKQ